LRRSPIRAVALGHEQLTVSAKFTDTATVNDTASGSADLVSDTQGST
jgi:hypothetical protein